MVGLLETSTHNHASLNYSLSLTFSESARSLRINNNKVDSILKILNLDTKLKEHEEILYELLYSYISREQLYQPTFFIYTFFSRQLYQQTSCNDNDRNHMNQNMELTWDKVMT